MQNSPDLQTGHTIRFILNGQVVQVSNIDPMLTVLQYLREHQQLTGSKEGCAEGDCGTCTVVIGELVEGRIRLRSVNACIQFVAMLHGKILFTVESLQPDSSASLHPVQQAMVDSHASQCGFCTPGFVMSLFALFKTTVNPDRQQINDALSGNLCRCTGYRPIIEAAQTMTKFASDDHWLSRAATSTDTEIDDDEQALIDKLGQINSDKTLHLQHRSAEYFAPTRLEDLPRLCADFPTATLIAGNTDVGLWVNKQLRELPVMISLASVTELKTVEQTDSQLSIGAAVTLADAFAELLPHFPTLTELFRRFASMPVRNAGTLVGNIANGSPIGDLPPLLLALQAEVVLHSAEGQRVVALDDFYLGYMQKDLKPGEFIHSLRIPLNSRNDRVAAYKISKRYDQDISAVCGAFALRLNDENRVEHIRIAFGGMAAVAQRALRTEQALLGKTWNQASVQAAAESLAQDFTPLSDLRASADYRLTIARNLLTRFYLQGGQSKKGQVVSLDELLEVHS